MHAVVAVVKLQSPPAPPGGGFGAPGASTTEYHTQAMQKLVRIEIMREN
jgi:hypothetical protein